MQLILYIYNKLKGDVQGFTNSKYIHTIDLHTRTHIRLVHYIVLHTM